MKKKRKKEPYKNFHHMHPLSQQNFPLCKTIFLWEWALLFAARPVLINKGS